MSEMVDKVARLIQEMVQIRRASISAEHNLNYLRAYEPIARAVIEAMRKPTPGMVKHVECHPDLMGYGDDGFDWVWSTMIDEALKD